MTFPGLGGDHEKDFERTTGHTWNIDVIEELVIVERQEMGDAVSLAATMLSGLDHLGSDIDSGKMSVFKLPLEFGERRIMIARVDDENGDLVDHIIVNDEVSDTVKEKLNLAYWEFVLNRETLGFHFAKGTASQDYDEDGWNYYDYEECALIEIVGDKLLLNRGEGNWLLETDYYDDDELLAQDYRMAAQLLTRFLKVLDKRWHEPGVVCELE